jgi:hypothetical protein
MCNGHLTFCIEVLLCGKHSVPQIDGYLPTCKSFFHVTLRIRKNNDGTKEKRWGVYSVYQDFRLDYYADAWNNESASVGFTIILEMVTDASPSVYVQSPEVHVAS